MSLILWPFKIVLWAVTFSYYDPWKKEIQYALPEEMVIAHIGVVPFPSSKKLFIKEWGKIFHNRGNKVVDFIAPGLPWQCYQRYQAIEDYLGDEKEPTFSDLTGEEVVSLVEDSKRPMSFHSLVCSSLLREVEESETMRIVAYTNITDTVIERKQAARNYLRMLEGIDKLISNRVIPSRCPESDCGVSFKSNPPHDDGKCSCCGEYLGEEAESEFTKLCPENIS